MENVLVGKTINQLKISDDKLALLFKTDEDDIVVNVDADCCSSSWIEHIEIPALGFPCKVFSVEDLDLPGSQDDHPEYDCLQVYGLKISTDKGDIVIDYRNSSNGYYGGSLSWPGEYFYGGVYGQTVSKHNWIPVEKDL